MMSEPDGKAESGGENVDSPAKVSTEASVGSVDSGKSPAEASKAETSTPATGPDAGAAATKSSGWRKSLRSAGQNQQAKAPPPPPKKKKRREGTLSAMSGFLSFLLVLLVAGAFGVIAFMHKLKEPGPLSQDRVVYFPPRSDPPEMLAQLEREGVVASPGVLNYALLFSGARGKIKPGEYLFRAHVSMREVIDLLVSGKQVMHSFTVPEGLTSDQIVQRMRENDMLAGDITETPKEGALLPDTYKFPRGFPRNRLIAKMQEDQRKLLAQIWEKRAPDLPLRTPFELVTLASIVEKETGKAEERPRVAAVFVNRLRKHMRLQSDPTIIYGLVGGKGALGRGILRAEIEKWTPYNTYAIDGLPPGPIANPGRAALEATAHPAATDDLYFVADGTGGHVFANSLSDHSRNVQQWRRIEKESKDKSDAPADRATPGAVPPAAPGNDKRTQAPMGRLTNLASNPQDFPAGRTMAADDGATHRLGLFSAAGPAFFLGGFADPTEPAAPDLVAFRRKRAFFTEDVAQLRAKPSEGFDPTLIARGDDATTDPDMAAESEDGRALGDGAGDIASYPVSPEQRAEQKARAARLGLGAGSDEGPLDALIDRGAGDAQPTPAPVAVGANPRLARPRAFDASEGTALDPLRDKSWDLSSAKTIPSTTSLR